VTPSIPPVAAGAYGGTATRSRGAAEVSTGTGDRVCGGWATAMGAGTDDGRKSDGDGGGDEHFYF
jgi:hypothetical protein